MVKPLTSLELHQPVQMVGHQHPGQCIRGPIVFQSTHFIHDNSPGQQIPEHRGSLPGNCRNQVDLVRGRISMLS